MARAATKTVPTLGVLADAIFAKNAEIAAINAKVKELELEKRDLEGSLISQMQEADTDIVRGKRATVSISETTRPQIADPEAFFDFVVRKKAYQLFERRIAANAYKEMKDSLKGGVVPGLTEYNQIRLNVRKV